MPFAALLPVVALDVANLIYGYGAARDSFALFGPTLSLFALGLVFFTSHYLVLRGFYALEHTRLVFVIQCVVAAVNIALAYGLTRGISPGETSPRLVIAYIGAYGVGAVVSFVVLSRLVGGLEERTLLRFAVRLVPAAAVAAAVAWGVSRGCTHSSRVTASRSRCSRSPPRAWPTSWCSRCWRGCSGSRSSTTWSHW